MTAETREASLSAPYSVEFPFNRTVGEKIGTFLGGLRDGRLYGVRTETGAVLCPVLEFDPADATATRELVPLEPSGTVRHWTWVPTRPGDGIDSDHFAWALIRIDGTEGALFHVVDTGGDITRMRTGLRVRPRWRDERVGSIRDIACFEPEEQV
ncbi:DNA-binding protein [Nocardia donostiensis]|uniref:DNA-binding protein n=1 Tax=Nocardia donostiensis TaxID=1538463 RepID=A0A1V2TGG7_9NOCA|nr:DNA-binding protein [Nocardia donostiensis]ONM48612.1 DNA-binding protein [Nocardia donostiensis]OQS16801.1 DNA-binding protein [Nocardia donostiensis]OQS23266.1 DNA-binding protein [Nocardia donostiensis]